MPAPTKWLIITCGPGCGKTTIIKGLTSVFRRAEKHILLAAPTGRAGSTNGTSLWNRRPNNSQITQI
ncbi:MAG: AAA family ATPase [Bdellovibrionota bacterium]